MGTDNFSPIESSTEHSILGWIFECFNCDHLDDTIAQDFGCRRCGRKTVSVRMNGVLSSRAQLVQEIADSKENSLWRYHRLIPVPQDFRSNLSIGMTPLLNLGEWSGVSLFVKDDTRMPSCSTKDRASEVVLARGRQIGCNKAVVASTGNAAASLSCVGAAHGIEVEVFVPQSVPLAKLRQIQAHGAAVDRQSPTYAEALERVKSSAGRPTTMDRTTGINPFTREGKKTCAFEIAEQLDWAAPDWVVVPVGDGNLLSAIWKGFLELYSVGLIASLPRLLCVQSIVSPAIHQHVSQHRTVWRPGMGGTTKTTIAESIYVTDPQDTWFAVDAIEASDGMSILVTDEEITVAQDHAARSLGLFPEPSSAAAFAGLRAAVKEGVLVSSSTVVIIMTGHGLKSCALQNPEHFVV